MKGDKRNFIENTRHRWALPKKLKAEKHHWHSECQSERARGGRGSWSRSLTPAVE